LEEEGISENILLLKEFRRCTKSGNHCTTPVSFLDFKTMSVVNRDTVITVTQEIDVANKYRYLTFQFKPFMSFSASFIEYSRGSCISIGDVHNFNIIFPS
jgi:hypothetical protein